MSGKNANGEGTKPAKRKDGRWWIRYTVQGMDGPKRKALYGKTRAEVVAKLRVALAERDGGAPFEASNMTFGEHLELWLKNSAAPSVKPGTFVRYEGIVRNHLKPRLGAVKLKDLTPAHLQSFYFERLEAGLASGTVRQIHAVASRALKQARKWKLIQTNPAEDATPPRLVATRESRTLNQAEALRFLRAVRAWRMDRYALFLLALTTGMRQGEILALRWEDLDLRRGEAQVVRTVDTWSAGLPRYGTTKTGKKRTIKLADATTEALKAHRKDQLAERLQAPEWKDASLVFTGPTGDVIRRTNLYQGFIRLLKREGFPEMTFHELRHSTASLLLENGIDPKTTQKLLGHADLRVTLEVYSHVSEKMERAAARQMDILLG